MKRFFTLTLATFVATMLMAQNANLEYSKQPSFMLSKYNNCPQSMTLKMKASAQLKIEKQGTQKLVGKTDAASFEVKADPDTTYDSSYKIYTAQFSNFSIKYTTYAFADELSIVIDHKAYTLSCIDGGMDVHIKYLAHQYTANKAGEKLYLSVQHDLPLEAADKSKILLKKGSYCLFEVIDPQQK